MELYYGDLVYINKDFIDKKRDITMKEGTLFLLREIRTFTVGVTKTYSSSSNFYRIKKSIIVQVNIDDVYSVYVKDLKTQKTGNFFSRSDFKEIFIKYLDGGESEIPYEISFEEKYFKLLRRKLLVEQLCR